MPDSGTVKPKVRLRTAKTADAADLAEVYWCTASKLPEHFLPTLGRAFLECYHRILLAERHSLVMCLEDQSGKVVGFVSGTAAMEEHVAALSRNRVVLVLSAIPAIARMPSLLGAMYRRFQATRRCEERPGFISVEGPRLEYWGCIEGAVAPAEALDLIRAWLAIFRRLGGFTVLCEVESSNEKVLRIHKAFGATVEREFITGDGRERFILKYDLNEEKTCRRIGS
jgi:hypothetical protein